MSANSPERHRVALAFGAGTGVACQRPPLDTVGARAIATPCTKVHDSAAFGWRFVSGRMTEAELTHRAINVVNKRWAFR